MHLLNVISRLYTGCSNFLRYGHACKSEPAYTVSGLAQRQNENAAFIYGVMNNAVKIQDLEQYISKA